MTLYLPGQPPFLKVRSSSVFEAFGLGSTFDADTPDTLDPIGFGGQHGYYRDYTTGLYLLTHRYYDANAGRFVTRDPIGYTGGINLYGFAGNNPVNESDPSGFDPRRKRMSATDVLAMIFIDKPVMTRAYTDHHGVLHPSVAMPEGEVPGPGEVASVAESASKEIALGLSPYYKTLAAKTGSATWRQWVGRVVNQPASPRFGRLFHQAAQRASRIHFTLDGMVDGIEDIGKAVEKGKKGFVENNFTNAELHHIMTNATLRAKTIFYLGGKIVKP